MKTILLLVAVLGCGSQRWSDDGRRDFMRNCTVRGSVEYCECVMGEMESRYSEDEVYMMPLDEVYEIAEDCRR